MQLFQSSMAYTIVERDVSAERISHAYLLLTPDARNLRSWLKELAKAVLKADARAARLIDEEQYSDCIVFPARGEKASVAQLKAMLEEVYIKPVEGERKVFLLDNVQDMLASAQNKLLKVLEEPPRNVYFILGALSEFPVLSTIKSRAKRLEAAGFTEAQTEQYIRERYPQREDAREIAAMSGGILGRAEELAEGGSLREVGAEAVQLLLTITPAGIPAAARRYAEKGETVRLLGMLRLVLRDALRLKLGRAAGADTEPMRRIAQRFDVGTLVRAQEKITQAEKNIKFNANAAVALEVLLAEITEGR